MNRWKCLLFILAFLLQIGCAALFTEQEYVLIDRPVREKATFNGEIYALPERADIRKVVLLGSGKIRNIEIHVRDKRNQWEPAKKVHGGIQFPYEIPLIAKTDAIKIIKHAMTGAGRIETIQFYTIADKGD
ncbi:hypothetical protein F4009_08715 [Candidatus Poribacteria bacterium]|nr:hypothetical protein [Candidatus Poribacteria bacterium]MYH83168.1 hypothetical protein [Candidatus Poribacteria bacterium]MYK94060.1 hypothetical protein [Candidatus Poribacteria bacterium]